MVEESCAGSMCRSEGVFCRGIAHIAVFAAVAACAFALGACSSGTSRFERAGITTKSSRVVSYSRPVSRRSNRYKLGKPYRVRGRLYVPRHQPGYSRNGVASWYGPGFDGKPTANGEVYDSDALTGAHPTLPLPSIVEVTNLGNGRRVRVRVNDRGPFVAGRIIDLSHRAARRLGYARAGTARVNVRYVGPADQ